MNPAVGNTLLVSDDSVHPKKHKLFSLSRCDHEGLSMLKHAYISGCNRQQEHSSGNRSLSGPFPVLTAPRQVIALLELPTMQLAGNKGPAMTVDTMREVDTAHANPAVVAAFEPPLVQIVPLLHAPPCKYTCTSTA